MAIEPHKFPTASNTPEGSLDDATLPEAATNTDADTKDLSQESLPSRDARKDESHNYPGFTRDIAGIVELTEQLIRLRTTPEHPDQLQQALDMCRSRLSCGTVEYFECNGHKSILAYNRAARPDRFRVILNGHLDVIPGKDHQYSPEIRGTRLYGVGATDMKANVACLIDVFNEMAPKVTYPLALQLVTEEELGGFWGTKHQIEQGVRGDFIIAAESTNFNIVNQAKGVLWARITAFGETAHGAYPWRGVNAIQKMARFLSNLEKEYPTPSQQEWCTTVNVASIRSPNTAYNKIPDQCEVQLDIRYLPSESKDALARLKALVPSDFTCEIVADEAALCVPESNLFVQMLQRTTEEIRSQKTMLYCAQGSSDARHYTRVGDAGVEFGPIGGEIGADEEWIDIPSLKLYCDLLKRYLQDVETLINDDSSHTQQR
jgi:succinyl-diaminopimelate desuccinylase